MSTQNMTLPGHFLTPAIDLSEFRAEMPGSSTMLGLPTDEAGRARLQRRQEEWIAECDTRMRVKAAALGFEHLIGRPR